MWSREHTSLYSGTTHKTLGDVETTNLSEHTPHDDLIGILEARSSDFERQTVSPRRSTEALQRIFLATLRDIDDISLAPVEFGLIWGRSRVTNHFGPVESLLENEGKRSHLSSSLNFCASVRFPHDEAQYARICQQFCLVPRGAVES